MKVSGNYLDDGFAHLEGLIPSEVAHGLLQMLKRDLGPGAIPLDRMGNLHNLLKRRAFELSSNVYPPMRSFLWGLTPVMCGLAGCELLPTYGYLRIYREGDVCRVHSDRHACEHSLSLTLDYSDGVIWDLEVGKEPRAEPTAQVDDDFGAEPYAAIGMQVGDAVLYRGVHHRHGRMSPNPNGWSAHLFLHWVDRNGPHSDHAFDGEAMPTQVNFSFV